MPGFLKRKRKVIGVGGEIVLLCQVLWFRRTRREPRHFYKGDHPQNAEVEKCSSACDNLLYVGYTIGLNCRHIKFK